MKPKVLLHICCAPDATATVEQLTTDYDVIGFFHNPNIQPEAEFQRRLHDAHLISQTMGFQLMVPLYQADDWFRHVRGLENEPEKGKRCLACYEFNLQATAEKAAELDIPFFTTTLTISPHKRAAAIMTAGQAAAKKWQTSFLPIDFKKNDGFKRSLVLSKQLKLYRQNYCGCKFTLRVQSHA